MLRALQAAFGLFTIIPTRPLETVDRDIARGAILAFPWVGLAAGCAAGAAAGVVTLCGGGAVLAAVAGLAVIAAITGAMHLDGVADTADGLGSRQDRDEALRIMKRSDIGPMGVATLVLVLLLDAAALASPRLAGAGLVCALAAMPAVGRVSALAATGRWVPCARPGGFGSLFAGLTSVRGLVLDAGAAWLVTIGLGALSGGWWGALAFGLAALVAWGVGTAWQEHLLKRLGGLTGDTFGSLIEVAQTVFLLAVALAA